MPTNDDATAATASRAAPPRRGGGRWRALALNLALLAVVLAACLALTEWGLRLAVGNANTTVLYEPDPEIIARMRPDLDAVLPDPFTGERVRLRTDARGNRIADDADGPAPQGAKRVVVYGDSNIAALYTAYANGYPARLGARLGSGVEVVNAGIYGGGPDQSLLRMEREWDQVRPDLVVFQLFLDNDFGDLLRNRLLRVEADGAGGSRLARIPHDRPDPAFARGRQLEARYLTVRYLRQAVTAARGALKGGDGGKGGGLRPDSMGVVVETAAGTVPAPAYIDLQLRRAEEEVERYKAGPPISWFYDHYEYDLALRPDGEGARLKRDLMAGVLAEAQRFVASKGGRIVFLVEPSSRDMTQNLPIGPAELAAASPAYRPRASEAFVTGTLRGLGAEVVPLWDAFEKADASKVYLVGDDHWNPAGMDLAAAETARLLRGRWPDLFPGGAS